MTDALDEFIAAIGPLRLPDKYCPFEPTAKQEFFLRLDDFEAFFGGSAGPGKALALDIPIPTSDGWTSMAEIRPGTLVFDADGQPRRVVAVGPVQFKRPCAEVTFSDGQRIVCDEEHEWVTMTYAERGQAHRRTSAYRARRRATRESRVSGKKSERFTESVIARNRARVYDLLEPPSLIARETRDIAATLHDHGRVNHSVPVAAPLSLPKIALPIDPYTLGVWLGDGTSREGSITNDPSDDQIIAVLPYRTWRIPSNPLSVRVEGLTQMLRAAGLCRDKHIPGIYLRASHEQRLSLLQGIVDTDGHIDKRDGRVEITLTRWRLVESVCELISTLGIRYGLNEGRACLQGRDIGPRWRITFQTGLEVARLDRKREAQHRGPFRRWHDHRYIVDVRRVDSVPVRCIEVEGGIYLAGRRMVPTHNSWGLLMAALQYVDVPGYHALLLRPALGEFEQPGGLIDVAHDWLGDTDARWHGGNREWTFPSGATLRFGYLANVGDLKQYKGPSYSFCVARGTRIRMGDGSECAIEAIREGDEVMTLCGPRLVTRTHSPGRKPCVLVKTPQGQSIVSLSHRLLTDDGWVAPLELISKMCQQDAPKSEAWREMRCLEGRAPGRLRRLGRLLSVRLPRRVDLTVVLPANGASAIAAGNGYRAFERGCQAKRPLAPWFVRLVLHEPSTRPMARGSAFVSPERAHARVLSETPSSQDWMPDYPTDRGCDDAPVPVGPGDDLTRILERGEIERGSHLCVRADGRENIRSGKCREAGLGALHHPYTKAILDVREGVRTCAAEMVPMGEREVFDLTVAGASHYITDAGIVSANCGFDELTSFPEALYRGMFRILRQPKGQLDQVPLRMRSASNPGDIGHAWVKSRFVDPQSRAPGVRYVPAKIVDNPHIDINSYKQSLSHMTPVDQERLMNGDWDVMEEGGKFHRDDFEVIDSVEATTPVRSVRYWDLAATEVSASNPDPDYTCGVLLDRDRDGRFTIRHIVHGRFSDEEVEKVVGRTAEEDGHAVDIYIEQEPGASGKLVVSHFKRQVLSGYACYAGLPRGGNKEVRARPVAAAVANHFVRIIRGAHLTAFLDEASIFPNGAHDDFIDALTGAHTKLTEKPEIRMRTSVARRRLPTVGDRFSTL